MQVKVASDYLDRFRHALDRLGVEAGERIMLAVSGGPDSLALLVLASSWAAERIVVATVDHQLRADSADEAEYVGRVCRQFALPHITLKPEEKISGNIQSSARAARYDLLDAAAKKHDCALISTAHHAEDQLETLLMRLARGSGVNGMAGIRARNGHVIRPLLDFSKSELEEICTTASVQPVRDPSNENAEFDRVAMRLWLAQNRHPFDPVATNRTALALNDAAAALDWMAEALAAEHIAESDDIITLQSQNLPKEMQRRLLLTALLQADPGIAPRGEAIERLITDMSAGRTTTIGNILCQGGDIWCFSPAPSRRKPK